MKRLAIIILLSALSLPLHSQERRMSVSTNLLSWAELATINAEASFAAGRHISVYLEGRFNPWTWKDGDPDSQFQLRQRELSAGMRYWPWFVNSGMWIAAGLQIKEYNFGGVLSRMTEEGRTAGVDFGLGYSFMLSAHWNLDLGIWGSAGYKKFKQYSCPLCARILHEGEKPFIAPDNAAISLVYVF